MDIKKVVTTVFLSAASVGSFLLLKNKGSSSSEDASSLVKSGSETVKAISETFLGVTEEEANNIAQGIDRGVKAIINGDTLTYVYRSASGKTKNIAEFTKDSKGEVIGTLFSNFTANSPRKFGRELIELIKLKTDA